MNMQNKSLGKKSAIFYMASFYIVIVVESIRSTIIARILGPRACGWLAILFLIPSYGSYLYLGLLPALVREVSFLKGQGKPEEVQKIKNIIFSLLIIISSIAGPALLIFSAFFMPYKEDDLLAVSCLMVFVLIFNQFLGFLVNNFIAEKKFVTVGLLRIANAIVISCITIFLVAKLNIIGVPLGIASGSFIMCLFIHKKFKFKFEFKIETQRFLSIVKVGFPLMLILVIQGTYLFTVDRIMILEFLGTEYVGYYCLTTILYIFPFYSFSKIMFPRLAEKYGEIGNDKKLEPFIYFPIIATAYIMAVIFSIIHVILPLGVKSFLPKFIPGITCMRLSIIGLMCLSMSIVSQRMLIATNRHRHCLYFLLCALVAKMALLYFFLRQGMGINGVATANNIIYSIYSICIMIYMLNSYKNNYLQIGRSLVAIYTPFCYALLILGLLYYKDIFAANIFIKLSVFIIFLIIPLGLMSKKKFAQFMELYR
jgi:O-antigen/teichoic acid export membrane protein